jgi:hypothetical protein
MATAKASVQRAGPHHSPLHDAVSEERPLFCGERHGYWCCHAGECDTRQAACGPAAMGRLLQEVGERVMAVVRDQN